MFPPVPFFCRDGFTTRNSRRQDKKTLSVVSKCFKRINNHIIVIIWIDIQLINIPLCIAMYITSSIINT